VFSLWNEFIPSYPGSRNLLQVNPYRNSLLGTVNVQFIAQDDGIVFRIVSV
jgi:hypothetical protein